MTNACLKTNLAVKPLVIGHLDLDIGHSSLPTLPKPTDREL